MAKISVIIPVYNVEQYLSKCLDSVLNQTFKDLEVICVNDCSPDNSLNILEEYSKKDNRVIVFNREKNGGLSAARNSGIDIATGDYIYFLDSDDWIDLDYIEKMYEAAELSRGDIVANANIISEKKSSSIPYNHAPSQSLQKDTFIDSIDAIDKIICNVWSKLYKRSFLKDNNLKFPEGYINEDLYFQFISFAYTDKIYFIKESNHHYLDRTDGIMNTIVDKDIPIIKIYNLVIDYYNKHNLLDKKIKIFSVMPHYNINSEEKYDLFKRFMENAKSYIESNLNLFNDLEIFFMNNILNTKNYDEYKSKFPSSVTISYIRRQR